MSCTSSASSGGGKGESSNVNKVPVMGWDVERVCTWARENNIPEFQALARNEIIDGPVLVSIDETDLQDGQLASALRDTGIVKFGQLRRLQLALSRLRQEDSIASIACFPSIPSLPRVRSGSLLSFRTSGDTSRTQTPPEAEHYLSRTSEDTSRTQTPPSKAEDYLSSPPSGTHSPVCGPLMAGQASTREFAREKHEERQRARYLDAGKYIDADDRTPSASSASATAQAAYALHSRGEVGGRHASSRRSKEVHATSLPNSPLQSSSGYSMQQKRLQTHTQLQARTQQQAQTHSHTHTHMLEPGPSAILRLLISMLWAMTVVFASAGVMTFVHDRVPDMDKYPPLPDVVLDHIPAIPWAFEASEVCIILLAFFFILTIAFHKHRLQVLRRFFAIVGSVFLLRCCTMLVTSLSVPGVHLKCKPFPAQMTNEDKLRHAWKIASTLGSSIQGTRTCGDYMFSGHTAVLTILNRFVGAYTPDHWHLLHHICAVLNGAGMFFILAAHEHYTLDVLMGFYIATRTFQSYHTVANSLHASQGRCEVSHFMSQMQTKRWFPMVSFLEEHTYSLPNEYQIPWGEKLEASLAGTLAPSYRHTGVPPSPRLSNEFVNRAVHARTNSGAHARAASPEEQLYARELPRSSSFPTLLREGDAGHKGRDVHVREESGSEGELRMRRSLSHSGFEAAYDSSSSLERTGSGMGGGGGHAQGGGAPAWSDSIFDTHPHRD